MMKVNKINKVKLLETYSHGTSPTSIQSPSLSSYVSTYSDPCNRSRNLLSLRLSLPGAPCDPH
ncbi:hypothetical protein HanRHA438_Chr09g0407471 [Helianthus annuus]|nr:hypothetical protein HanIR_Chr09g0426541 [Helianthus annuus]KAJ0888933.1 hypothetical protein HanRHA438_Chr09g0407471 [Helianthus annuus]